MNDELRTAIFQQIANLKEVYDLLPLSWFEVKQQLESMNEDFITYRDYIGICYKNEIPEGKDQDQLIDLLHRLGLVLNFRDHPILKDTNVLKPNWVTEGIYALLSDENLKTKAQGIFTPADLTRILNPARYPTDRHVYLIDLMKKFELCFALECKPEKYLIAGLLPKDQPDKTELEGETLEFQYHYKFLPESIISRFIVNTHEKIHNQVYWRSGVMLQYEQYKEIYNIARIKSDPEDKKIFITISGRKETRRLFLGILREFFQKIHKTLPDLEITEWVPVLGYPKYPPLDYQELLGLEKMKVVEYPIGKLNININIPKLLDGYESRESRWKSQKGDRIANKDVPDFLEPPLSTEINIIIHNNTEANAMTESYQPKYDLSNAQVGGIVDTAASGSNVTFNQNNYTPEQKQSLAEAAAEIQKLLKQLEETNPTATESEQIAHLKDNTTPNLRKRALSGLQGGIETLIDEFILENKLLKVSKAVIKGWLQPDK